MKKILFVLFFVVFSTANAAEQHYIRSNDANGEVIILDDGSVWQVAGYDTITSELWLELSDVVINDDEDKMISIDDNESVDVQRVR